MNGMMYDGAGRGGPNNDKTGNQEPEPEKQDPKRAQSPEHRMEELEGMSEGRALRVRWGASGEGK
jgi:hypothetical protein